LIALTTKAADGMEHTDDNMVKPTILIVDDTPDNLSLLRELLKDLYLVKVANGGERALKLAEQAPRPT